MTQSDDLPLLTGLFNPGDRVRIMDGRYLGKTGTVTEIRGDRVMVLGESGQKQVAFKPGSLVIIPPQGSVVGELDDMLMSARIPPRVQPTLPATQAGSDLDDLLSSERISSAGHTPWVSPADSPVTGENWQADGQGDSGNSPTYSLPSPVISPLVSPVNSPATGETLAEDQPQPAAYLLSISPAISPTASPVTGEKLQIPTTQGSDEFPDNFPDEFPAYRGKAIAALEDAIAALKPKALPGHWITSRNKGGRTYYALRWIDGDGREKEESILASEVPKLQRRIDEGRILKEASKLVQMLNVSND